MRYKVKEYFKAFTPNSQRYESFIKGDILEVVDDKVYLIRKLVSGGYKRELTYFTPKIFISNPLYFE